MKSLKKAIILFLVLFLTACSSSGTTAGKKVTRSSTMKYTVKEMSIHKKKQRIYGELYQPSGKSATSLVILSHGFGGSHDDLSTYAKTFARKGIAAFTFDFIGGGATGDMTKMSVLTEASDLNTVVNYFRKRKGINKKQIYLMGASQGGFVSTYVAANRAKDIAGLVLLYPAFVLQDDSKKANPNPKSGPATRDLMGMTIGRIYDVDAQSFDIYKVMKKYKGQVLIIHGSDDAIAPISYSRRAVKTFPHARLITINGADHGFYGDDETTAAKDALTFISRLMNSKK